MAVSSTWNLAADSLFLRFSREVPRWCIYRNLSSTVVLQNKTTKKRKGQRQLRQRHAKPPKPQPYPPEPVDPDKFYFQNRNPRSLELLGIAAKPLGFATKRLRPDYYHRLMFEFSNRHVTAYVEHNSGLKVVQASTKEFCISRYLYRTSDVAAAYNIGRVLAARCKDMGLYRVMWEHRLARRSKKAKTLVHAVSQGGVLLNEPRVRTTLPEAGRLPPGRNVF